MLRWVPDFKTVKHKGRKYLNVEQMKPFMVGMGVGS